MMTNLTAPRLELCRLVREHCYQAVQPVPTWIAGPAADEIVRLAQAALEVPIEEMASWFNLSDTVLANLRLAMMMTEQRLTDTVH